VHSIFSYPKLHPFFLLLLFFPFCPSFLFWIDALVEDLALLMTSLFLLIVVPVSAGAGSPLLRCWDLDTPGDQ